MLRVVLTLTACSLKQQGSQVVRRSLTLQSGSVEPGGYPGRRVTVYGTSVLVAENGQIEGGPLNPERRPDRTG